MSVTSSSKLALSLLGALALSALATVPVDAQQLKSRIPVKPWAGCCSSCTYDGGWKCTGCSEAVGGKCSPSTIKTTCTTSSDTTLCHPTPKPKTKSLTSG